MVASFGWLTTRSRRTAAAPLNSSVRIEKLSIPRLYLAALIFALSELAWAGQQSLCSVSEQVLFSCHTGHKVVSVCASKQFTRNSGYIQYRFGIKSLIEFQYPQSHSPPNDHFYYYDVGYSRGWIDHLSFKNGKYRYIVYEKFLWDGDIYGGDHHTSTSGVIVVAPNGRESDLRCDSHKFRKFGPEVHLLQSDDFFPYKG